MITTLDGITCNESQMTLFHYFDIIRSINFVKMRLYLRLFTLIFCLTYVRTEENRTNKQLEATNANASVGCVCGVFLSGQFKKGSKEQPQGNPALLHEHSDVVPCTNIGNKLCTNKCLDVIVKHLPNSPSILCAAIDRDCHKERAYLFIKNCKDEWINTNLSAGREYCCKDGLPCKCPVLSL